MSEADLPLPHQFTALVEMGILRARELISALDEDDDRQIAPIAFVGNTARDELCPMELEGIADQFPSQIRRVAGRIEADVIFTIMGGLALDPDHARDYHAILDRYDSLADSPYAIEALYFQLETHAGTWRALAPLEPSNGRKTVGEVHMRMQTGAQGPFTGLLPQPRDRAQLPDNLRHYCRN
jgi:hypothetical protein